jgi:hypothetical protein
MSLNSPGEKFTQESRLPGSGFSGNGPFLVDDRTVKS